MSYNLHSIPKVCFSSSSSSFCSVFFLLKMCRQTFDQTVTVGAALSNFFLKDQLSSSMTAFSTDFTDSPNNFTQMKFIQPIHFL